MSVATGTNIITITVVGGSIRVEQPNNISAISAYRSAAPAERNLASWDDVTCDEEIVDARVERLADLDGKGVFHVVLFEYNRVVRL